MRGSLNHYRARRGGNPGQGSQQTRSTTELPLQGVTPSAPIRKRERSEQHLLELILQEKAGVSIPWPHPGPRELLLQPLAAKPPCPARYTPPTPKRMSRAPAPNSREAAAGPSVNAATEGQTRPQLCFTANQHKGGLHPAPAFQTSSSWI